MWEVLARVVPFADQRAVRSPSAQIPGMVLAGRRPTLGLVPADTPVGVRALMCACWAPDPAARPTAARAAQVLQAAAAAATVAALPHLAGALAETEPSDSPGLSTRSAQVEVDANADVITVASLEL